jgi:hypothetical protein
MQSATVFRVNVVRECRPCEYCPRLSSASVTSQNVSSTVLTSAGVSSLTRIVRECAARLCDVRVCRSDVVCVCVYIRDSGQRECRQGLSRRPGSCRPRLSPRAIRERVFRVNADRECRPCEYSPRLSSASVTSARVSSTSADVGECLVAGEYHSRVRLCVVRVNVVHECPFEYNA